MLLVDNLKILNEYSYNIEYDKLIKKKNMI